MRAAGVDAVLSAVNAAKQLPSAISPAYTKMLLHDAYKCNVMILLTSACFPAVFACAFKKIPAVRQDVTQEDAVHALLPFEFLLFPFELPYFCGLKLLLS